MKKGRPESGALFEVIYPLFGVCWKVGGRKII